MTTVELLLSLVALVPALVTLAGLRIATHREGPTPTELLSEIAYREHRQCCTALYSWGGGYPDRCVYPEDHYGKCES